MTAVQRTRRLAGVTFATVAGLTLAGWLVFYVIKDAPPYVPECGHDAPAHVLDAYRTGLGTAGVLAALALAALILTLAAHRARMHGRDPSAGRPTRIAVGAALLLALVCAIEPDVFGWVGIAALWAGLFGGEVVFGLAVLLVAAWLLSPSRQDGRSARAVAWLLLLIAWTTLLIALPLGALTVAAEGTAGLCLG